MTLELVPRGTAPPLAELVRRFGGPVSNAVFDDGIEVFRDDGVDGVVAYRHGLGCAVAIGDPICRDEDKARLADAFRAECRRRGWHTVYAVASEAFAATASARGYASIEFARELVVDPRRDPLAGHAAQTLRGKVRRAAREGVVAAEYAPREARDEALEAAMSDAVRRWLEARRGPQVYLASFSPFAGRACKRWFHARRGEDVVGVMQLVRLDARDGYLLSQLVATPDAPPGTTELLGVTALRKLGEEGCPHATWGPAPLPELGKTSGLGSLSERIARGVFHAAGRAFHLEARNEYRRKFPVAATAPSYLLFDPPRVGPRVALEIMRAFHASSR